MSWKVDGILRCVLFLEILSFRNEDDFFPNPFDHFVSTDCTRQDIWRSAQPLSFNEGMSNSSPLINLWT